MPKPEIKNSNYIKIKNNNTFSYGGSQMWFGEKDASGYDKKIAGYGCGVIAAADLVLYLATQNEANQTNLTKKVCCDEELNKSDYLTFIKTIEKDYGKVISYVGMTGFSLAIALNQYFIKNKLNYKCSWKNSLLSIKKAFNELERMLLCDIPVIISIPGVLLRKNGLCFYRSKPQNLEKDKKSAYKFSAFGGHYVTATAIEQRQDGGKTITISSWGTRYYIDLDEYKKAIKTVQGAFVGGLINIKKLNIPNRALKISVKL